MSLRNLIACFTLISITSSILAHSPHDEIGVLELSPNYERDGTLFVHVNWWNNYLLKSIDGGASFRVSQGGRSSALMLALVFSPAFDKDKTILVGTADGAFRSLDGGMTWSRCFSGGAVSTIHTTGDREHLGLIYISTEKHVFISEDQGLTWTAIEPAGQTLGKVIKFAGTNPVFFVESTGNILGFSYNSGHWRKLNTFMEDSNGLVENLGRSIASFFEESKRLLNSTSGKRGLEDKQTEVQVSSVVVSPSYRSDKTLFAATTGKGIYKSVDGGHNWSHKNAGLEDLYVTDLAISPAYHEDGTLAACTAEGLVYFSTDGGEHWEARSNGLERHTDQTQVHCHRIRFSPSYINDKTLFVGKYEGLYKSIDQGKFWRHLNTLNTRILRYAHFSPNYKQDRTIFASSYMGEIYRTRDGGETWQCVNTGLRLSRFYGFQISPEFGSDKTLFTSSGNELFSTEDAADNWKELQWMKSPPGTQIKTRFFAISPDFKNDGELLIPSSGLWPRWSWTKYMGRLGQKRLLLRYNVEKDVVAPVEIEWLGRFVNSVTYSPQYKIDGEIFAGVAGKGIYKSVDRGASWEQSGLRGTTVQAIELSPVYSRDGTVFAVTKKSSNGDRSKHGWLYKSKDRGATWRRVKNGLEAKEVERVAISPAYDHDTTAFISTYGHGVFKSTDGGGSWQSLGFADNLIRNISVSPNFETDSTVLVCAFDGLYRSRDAGRQWESILNINRFEETRLAYAFRSKGGLSLAAANAPHGFNEKAGWHLQEESKASAGQFVVSATPGERVEFYFVGTAIQYIAVTGKDMGIAAISLNGEFQKEVDLYSNESDFQHTVFSIDGLKHGEHLFSVEVTGKKNKESAGYNVNVDAFEVTN